MTPKLATAVCMSALSTVGFGSAVSAQTISADVEPGTRSAAAAVTIGGAETWNAPAPGAASEPDCSGTRAWQATEREWMTTSSDWCSVEVGFRYRGAGGDVKMVVTKEGASSRSGRVLHASVDLPANGGETSPMQFIFPCPTRQASRLCLNYEATTDAGELSYDYQQLGVDAGAGVDDLLDRLEAELASAGRVSGESEIVGTRYLPADFRPQLEPHVEPIANIDFAAPSPAPLGKLRKRAR